MVDNKNGEPQSYDTTISTEDLDPYIATIVNSPEQINFSQLNEQQRQEIVKYFANVEVKIHQAEKKVESGEREDQISWNQNMMLCIRMIRNFDTFIEDPKVAERNEHHSVKEMVRAVRRAELEFDELIVKYP